MMCMGGLVAPIHLTKGSEVLVALQGLFLWCRRLGQAQLRNTVISAFTFADSIASSILYWQEDYMIIPKKDQWNRSIPVLGLCSLIQYFADLSRLSNEV